MLLLPIIFVQNHSETVFSWVFHLNTNIELYKYITPQLTKYITILHLALSYSTLDEAWDLIITRSTHTTPYHLTLINGKIVLHSFPTGIFFLKCYNYCIYTVMNNLWHVAVFCSIQKELSGWFSVALQHDNIMMIYCLRIW